MLFIWLSQRKLVTLPLLSLLMLQRYAILFIRKANDKHLCLYKHHLTKSAVYTLLYGAMDDLSNFIAGASMAISFVSMLGALAVYIVHEKMIKAQTKLINDFQLAEYKKKQEDEKKASLRAEIYKMGDNWRVIVQNEGVAPAKNIRLVSDDLNIKNGIVVINQEIVPFPILNRNDRFHIDIGLTEGCNMKPTIELIWNDDFSYDRSVSQALCFP